MRPRRRALQSPAFGILIGGLLRLLNTSDLRHRYSIIGGAADCNWDCGVVKRRTSDKERIASRNGICQRQRIYARGECSAVGYGIGVSGDCSGAATVVRSRRLRHEQVRLENLGTNRRADEKGG